MLLSLLVPARLHAYADPGSGILIWQMLLAGVAGALFYLRRLLRGRRDRTEKKTSPPDE